MGNYIGDLAGIEGSLREWGNYWGEVDQRARERYNHREARTALDRENRYQRDRSQLTLDAEARRAGLFESVDAQYAAMGPRNAPAAAATNGSTGPISLAPSATSPAQSAERPTAQPQPEQTGIMVPNSSDRWEPVNSPTELTPEQRRAWGEYITASYSGIGSSARRESMFRRLHEVGLGVDMHGNPVRRVTNTQNLSVSNLPDQFNIRGYGQEASGRGLSETGAQAAGEPSANATTQSTANTQSAVGLITGTQSDPSLRARDPDTSAALAPTPEMRMMHETVQSEMEQANVAARYGRSDEANQHFAQALQAQAAYLQQDRLVRMRAASQGHRTALADLLGLYSGRPEGTTRLAPTPEDRNQFVLQVLTNDGQWTATPGGPYTYEQLFQTARGLVDREAVMAETEANSEYIRARIAAGAQITVAQINALSDQQQRIAEAIWRQADNETRLAISQGEGELVVDSANNQAYYRRWVRGADGQPEPRITRYREQDVRVADTNGRRTERRMVGENLTGTVGVRPN